MLIHGINPATISKINYYKQEKRYGYHPLYHLLRRKKHPILAFLWPRTDLFDGIYSSAGIEICGTDGATIRWVPCKSNDAAKKAYYSAQEKLEAWVGNSICKFTKG